jgi:hypothetical protein
MANLPIPGVDYTGSPEYSEAIEVLHNLIHAFNKKFLDNSLTASSINAEIWFRSNISMDKALVDLRHGTISLKACLLKIKVWGMKVGKEIDRGIGLERGR